MKTGSPAILKCKKYTALVQTMLYNWWRILSSHSFFYQSNSFQGNINNMVELGAAWERIVTDYAPAV